MWQPLTIVDLLKKEIEQLKARVALLERKVSPAVDRYGVHDTAKIDSLRGRIKVDNG